MSEISRRRFVGGVGAALAASQVAAEAARSQKKPPNILFICSDTHQADACGFRGHPVIQTPNIDRLARRGTHFTTAYCGSPLCATARASLFSGMYPSDVGSWCNATVIREDVPTWGKRLHDHGYHCVATGKMDLSGSADGFEEIHTTHGHSRSPDVTSLFRRPMCFRPENRDQVEGVLNERRHGDERVLREAASFLESKAPNLTKPWALYVGFTAPLPYFVVERKYYDLYRDDQIPMPEIPDGYLDRLPTPWEVTRTHKCIATPIADVRILRARRAYYGLVTSLDQRIGRLLEVLDRMGQRENTVIIYTTDHGQSVGEHGLWFHNEPTDCSSRVPLVMSGPGIPEGAKVESPVMHVDLFPTFMELAGAPVPTGLRGHSLLPLIERRASQHPDFAYSECHAEGTCSGSFVIRRGPWKYIHYTYYDDLLFNVEEDPGEYRDVIRSREGQRVAAELHDVLKTQVNPTERTEAAFARQEQMLLDLCRRMSLEELLAFGFEKRLGRAQAISLLTKYKR